MYCNQIILLFFLFMIPLALNRITGLKQSFLIIIADAFNYTIIHDWEMQDVD